MVHDAADTASHAKTKGTLTTQCEPESVSTQRVSLWTQPSPNPVRLQAPQNNAHDPHAEIRPCATTLTPAYWNKPRNLD